MSISAGTCVAASIRVSAGIYIFTAADVGNAALLLAIGRRCYEDWVDVSSSQVLSTYDRLQPAGLVFIAGRCI